MLQVLDKVVAMLEASEEESKFDEETGDETGGGKDEDDVESEDGEDEQAEPASKPSPLTRALPQTKTRVWTDADVLLLIRAWNTVIDETTCTVDQIGFSFEDRLHHHFTTLSGDPDCRPSRSFMLKKQALVTFVDFVSEHNRDVKKRKTSSQNRSWFLLTPGRKLWGAAICDSRKA
ncbi:hypothetical protein Gpo141_00008337 [Globisporangium polare]